MKKLLILGSMVLALTACSNTQTVEQAQKYAPCTFPDSPTVEAPAWICDIMPKDLAAGATGYAKKSVAGMSVMRSVAINDARVQLASQFQTDVNNMFKRVIEASTNTTTEAGADENVLDTVENVTKNVVTRSLSNSKIIVTQASPAGGLYVLVGMDNEAYQENVNKVVDEVTQDSSLHKQFQSEKAQEALNEARSSMTSM